MASGGDDAIDNHVLFLTNHHADGASRHVERPKLVALGGDRFLAVWEEWTLTADEQTYDGVYAARIDATGAIQAGPTRVADGHLPRGDSAIAMGDEALWVTGDEEAHTLTVHRVNAELVYRASTID